MNGFITDIQRFSLNDGDGIRTTVFLKGCNMKCVWCHNPETINMRNDLMLYQNKCIDCGKCFAACPQNAHSIKDGGHFVDTAKCGDCRICVDVCYAGALRFSGREVSSEQVMKEIVQDEAYYKLSKGGVTFSGGEALCQAEFVNEVTDLCRERGIGVQIETNMLHSFDKIKSILSKMDTVMLDIKIFDDEKHKKYTGVSNKTIIENILKLDELGIPIVLRTPLIPGITDNDENLKSICKFASELKNLRYYELLNFNPLGIPKYHAMCEKTEAYEAKPLPDSRLEEIKGFLTECRVKISYRN